jgi:hypothetical protein
MEILLWAVVVSQLAIAAGFIAVAVALWGIASDFF